MGGVNDLASNLEVQATEGLDGKNAPVIFSRTQACNLVGVKVVLLFQVPAGSKGDGWPEPYLSINIKYLKKNSMPPRTTQLEHIWWNPPHGCSADPP